MRLTPEQIEIMKEELYSDLVEIIMQKWNCGMLDVMSMLYNSETFKKINDTGTILYYQSPGYVYDFFDNEMRKGKIE